MPDIEPAVKAQYSKFFVAKDSFEFKQLAEYYLETASFLKTDDIKIGLSRLWIRNVQKRLFIGLACELLLKAHYLQLGYGINVPKKGKRSLYKIEDVKQEDFRSDDTYPLGFLLDQFKNLPHIDNQEAIEHGFRIAKVFRNKEGHVAVYWHKFDAQNYTDIETAISLFYQNVFRQKLKIRISFEKNEKGIFEIE